MTRNTINGLILEGIAGTGKTTTFNLLSRRKEKEGLSIFDEKDTQRPFEYYKYFSKDAPIEILDELLIDVKNRGKDYIFDRFHLSQLYVYHHHLKWSDYTEIEKRLMQLNAKICVLTLDKTDIKSRIIDDYTALGYGRWLLLYGATETKQIENYWKAQIRLLDLMQHSDLPIIVINTSESTPRDVAKRAMTFWENTEIT